MTKDRAGTQERDTECQSHWILKDTAASVRYGEMSREEYEEQSGNTLAWTCSVRASRQSSVFSILRAEQNSGADTSWLTALICCNSNHQRLFSLSLSHTDTHTQYLESKSGHIGGLLHSSNSSHTLHKSHINSNFLYESLKPHCMTMPPCLR